MRRVLSILTRIKPGYLLAASAIVGAGFGLLATVVVRLRFPLLPAPGFAPPRPLPSVNSESALAPLSTQHSALSPQHLVLSPDFYAPRQMRLALAALFGFLALAVMLVAVFRFQFGGYDPNEDTLHTGGILTLVSAGMLGMSLALARRPSPPLAAAARITRSRLRFRYTLPGVFMLLLLAVLNGGIAGERVIPQAHYHVQMGLLWGGLLLTGMGLAGIRRPSLPRVERAELLTVAAITLLALVVRLWGVDTILHTWIDEFLFSGVITEMWDNPQIDMLPPLPSISSITGAFPYMQSITVSIFGADLLGLRATSAILGALTVPGVYVLARTLFNRKTGVIAALVLAAFPPHIHFSRLALYNIADPLFGTWALAFLARGVRFNRRPDYAWGGVMLGATHYFYEGGRLLYTPLVLGWIVLLVLLCPTDKTIVQDGKNRLLLWRRRLHWNGLLTTAAAFLIAIFPLYYTWSAQGLKFSPRFDEKRIPIAFLSDIPTYRSELNRAFAALMSDGKSEFSAYLGELIRRITFDIRDDYRLIRDALDDLKNGKPDRFADSLGTLPVHVRYDLDEYPVMLGRAFSSLQESGVSAFWNRVRVLPERMLEDFRDYYRHHVRPPLLQFFRDTDGSHFYYGGQTPLLLVYTAPFAMLGLFSLLLRPRSPAALLLPLWVFITIAGNSIIDQNNWTPRFVVVFPALAILVAVGIVGMLALLIPAAPHSAARAARYRTWAAGVITAALVVLQIVYYFGPHMTYYNREVRPIKDHIDLAYRSRDFPPGARIFIITDDLVWFDHFHKLERFWDFDMDYEKLDPLTTRQYILELLLEMPEDESVDMAFFIEPEDLATLHWLTENFDVGAPQFSPYDVPEFAQYALYYVPGVRGAADPDRREARRR